MPSDQSLPLSILVTEQPEGALLNLKDYREVSWLAKSYALTTLPSVSSLRALRLFAKDSETADPFAGFGDPVLDGAAGGTRGITLASLFSRDPVAAVDEVRKLTLFLIPPVNYGRSPTVWVRMQALFILVKTQQKQE